MAKKIIAKVKLLIPAGKATAAAPVGPALGQKKIPLKAFCDQFNEKTKGWNGSLPTKIYVYSDNTFEIIVNQPSTATLIKEALKLSKGGATPGKAEAGTLSKKQIEDIAKIKMKDTLASLESTCASVMGTARSMGVSCQKD